MLQVDLTGTVSGNLYIWGIKHYTDMHTDAQSAKKDVISTKPQKGHGRREDIPREEIEKGKRKRLRTLSLRGDPR